MRVGERVAGAVWVSTAVVVSACGAAEPDFGPNSGRCVPEPRPSGYFVASETYLIERAPACRGYSCMVQGWDERGHPEEADLRQFCTCRCDGEGDPSQFCRCPSGYQCTSVFRAGNPGLRGAYCTPSPFAAP